MSTTTSNLGLFKYDMVIDKEKPYSIVDSLNNNWDRLEAYSLLLQDKFEEIYDKLQPIGQPVIRLDDTLFENEVRLEGAIVLISDYPKLYQVYKNLYGQTEDGYFKLPDCRNRVFWGAIDYGYLEAGLPNITGGNIVLDDHAKQAGFTNNSALYDAGGFNYDATSSLSGGGWKLAFNASRSNSIYGKSSTVQPPAIKVRVITRYE